MNGNSILFGEGERQAVFKDSTQQKPFQDTELRVGDAKTQINANEPSPMYDFYDRSGDVSPVGVGAIDFSDAMYGHP